MSGLFSTFNVAKRGMFVQQKAIDVTSHNIANANTEGYSRQRVKIETSRPFGMPTLNSVAEPGQLGTGSQIAAIERVRDLFLDYQFRVEMSAYGKHTARQRFLNEVESIFNEPSDIGLSTLIGRFFDSWQELSKQPHSSNARTIVAQQSVALADELNHTYNQLDNLNKNIDLVMENTVFEINSILDQISQLNQQIIGVRVAGNMPNDLMDKRDLLVDELSSKFGIDVKRENFEGIDIVTLGGEGLKIIEATNKDGGMRLSYKPGDGLFWGDDPGLGTIPFVPVSGELAGYLTVKKDINDYIDQLNNLAKALAFSVNAVHSGKADSSEDNLPFFVNRNTDGTESDINAGNITVNKEILDDVMKIKTRTHDNEFDYPRDNDKDGDTDGERALSIARLRDVMINIQGIGSMILNRKDLFGSEEDINRFHSGNGLTIGNSSDGMKIDNYFRDIINRLGVQGQEAKRLVKNQEALLDSFEESRLSVSGVSLDEEMANLVQFQHAFNANAKIIATVDELLDVVVNGLKR